MATMTKTGSILALGSTLLIGGCMPMYGPGWENERAPDRPPIAYSRDLYPGYGSVQAIDPIRHDQESGSSIGLGAIAGAVVGGLIGYQVGEGKNNTAATVIGAAGGALIGHELEKRTQTQADQYRLTIRMENGSYQSLVQNGEFVDLRVGDRVHIDRDGAIRRY